MKILPICAALAACVSSMTPTFAAPPTAPIPALISQTFLLQHITPETVITQMHWDQKTANMLPRIGAVRIEAQDNDNSLRAQGSPAVLKAVGQIIHEMDIVPRAVQVKIDFFQATPEMVRSTGIDFNLIPSMGTSTTNVFYSLSQNPGALTMRKTLQEHHLPVLASPLLLTTNNTAAGISIQDSANGNHSLTVSPHINSDLTITLDLSLPTDSQQVYHTMDTVEDGKTVLLVSPPDAHGHVQIIFVTPTVVDPS